MSLDEQIDLVTENDEVIGNASKKDAHEKGLLHRTVIAEVIGSDDRWTLVQQAANKQDPGQFVSPIGGHVKSGETADEALKREAFEEYGLTDQYTFALVGKRIFNRSVNGHIENHYFILYEITTDQQPILNEESVSYKTFTKEEIKKELAAKPESFGDAFHFVVDSFYPEFRKK